ncbi:MAG: TonB-dependent receptor, partial [Campylobacterota bacterium]|nr:TonB-dependent receptor [Campylobacterota bacterium]
MLKRVVSLLTLFTYSLTASDDSLQSMESLLDEVTTIATKNRLNIDHTPGIVSIIKGDQLEKMGFTNFNPTVLDMVPGFFGANSRKISDPLKYLYSIDGVSLFSQLAGYGFYPQLPVHAIDRIEIIRGASSALYGLSAYAALINIVTKKGENQIWGAYKYHDEGHDYMQSGVMLHYAEEETSVDFRANFFSDKGFKQPITQDLGTLYGYGTYAPSALQNGSQHYDIGLHVGLGSWQISYERLQYAIEPSLGIARIFKPPLQDGWVRTDTRDLLEIRHNSSFDLFDLETRLGLFEFEQKVDDSYVFPKGFPLVPEGLGTDYYNDMHLKERDLYAMAGIKKQIGDHQILMGSRYLYSHLIQNDYGATQNLVTGEVFDTPSDVGELLPNVIRRIFSFWIQDYYELNEQTTFVGNLRYDYVSDLDEGLISPRLAVIHELDDENIVKLQYARAAMAPSYFSLYSNGDNSFIKGNPDIPIDKSDNYELSYIYKQFHTSFKSTLYYIDMFDVGSFIQAGTTEFSSNSIQSSGVELETASRFSSLNVQANLAYNFYSKMKFHNTQKYDDTIKEFPDLIANLILDYEWNYGLSSKFWYTYNSTLESYIPSQDVDEKHFVNIALSYMRNFDDQRFEATLSVFDLLNEKRA